MSAASLAAATAVADEAGGVASGFFVRSAALVVELEEAAAAGVAATGVGIGAATGVLADDGVTLTLLFVAVAAGVGCGGMVGDAPAAAAAARCFALASAIIALVRSAVVERGLPLMARVGVREAAGGGSGVPRRSSKKQAASKQTRRTKSACGRSATFSDRIWLERRWMVAGYFAQSNRLAWLVGRLMYPPVRPFARMRSTVAGWDDDATACCRRAVGGGRTTCPCSTVNACPSPPIWRAMSFAAC